MNEQMDNTDFRIAIATENITFRVFFEKKLEHSFFRDF